MVELAAGHNSISRESKPRKMWVAVILSLIFPGMGQYYNGEIKRAVILLITSHFIGIIGLAFIYFTENIIPLQIMMLAIIFIWIFAFIDSIRLTIMNKSEYFPSKYNNRWFKYIGVIIAAAILGAFVSDFEKALIVEAYRIPSGSMENTLLVGDFLMGKKCGADGVDINDLMIFRYPKDPSISYIKRCIAKGGQTIEIKNKQLFVDGKIVPLPEHGKHRDNRNLPNNGS
ncbi:MAG: signal peptidase I [candidate division Zixibacteria bacterium]|nr:signal peptidase I [candidate division Zixibacteria bacterium]